MTRSGSVNQTWAIIPRLPFKHQYTYMHTCIQAHRCFPFFDWSWLCNPLPPFSHCTTPTYHPVTHKLKPRLDINSMVQSLLKSTWVPLVFSLILFFLDHFGFSLMMIMGRMCIYTCTKLDFLRKNPCRLLDTDTQGLEAQPMTSSSLQCVIDWLI